MSCTFVYWHHRYQLTPSTVVASHLAPVQSENKRLLYFISNDMHPEIRTLASTSTINIDVLYS